MGCDLLRVLDYTIIRQIGGDWGAGASRTHCAAEVALIDGSAVPLNWRILFIPVNWNGLADQLCNNTLHGLVAGYNCQRP